MHNDTAANRLRRVAQVAFGLALFGISSQAWSEAVSLNATYRCEDGGGGAYIMHLGAQGALEAATVGSDTSSTGTYTYKMGGVKLSIPSVGFSEGSTASQVHANIITAFQTPSLRCNVIGLDYGEHVEGYVRCPKIGYIPGIGYDENAFEFFRGGSVKWRIWNELTGANDTLYSEHFGVYVISGSQFLMTFGLKDEDPSQLTGTIQGNGGILINELEPDKGPCNPS